MELLAVPEAKALIAVSIVVVVLVAAFVVFVVVNIVVVVPDALLRVLLRVW